MAHGGRAAPTARKARRAAVQRRARDMAIASCSTAVSVCGSRSARISGPGTALRGDAVGSRLAQIGDAVQLPHMGYVFRLQQRRQLTALAGSQRLEPFERISPKWIVIPDAFAAEQVRYPIGMLNASLGRRAALARHAPPILFFRAQRANQGTDPPLAGGQVISVRNSQRGGNRCSPSPPHGSIASSGEKSAFVRSRRRRLTWRPLRLGPIPGVARKAVALVVADQALVALLQLPRERRKDFGRAAASFRSRSLHPARSDKTEQRDRVRGQSRRSRRRRYIVWGRRSSLNACGRRPAAGSRRKSRRRRQA